MNPGGATDGTGSAGGGAAPARRVLVVTGSPGEGKTTRCRRLVQEARGAGLMVRGVLTFDTPDGTSVVRWLEDLGSGERMVLGRKAPLGQTAVGAPRWSLDEAALARCEAILMGACPTDVLVIDEVGPVELLHQRGSLAGVVQALQGPYGVAIVVVRPWLVSRFLKIVPDGRATVLHARDDGAFDDPFADLATGGAS